MLVCKSPVLLIRFCLEPITISLVLEGWGWSLLTISQSVTFSKSEFRSLASVTESFEEFGYHLHTNTVLLRSMIYGVKSFSNVNKNYTHQFAVIHIFVPSITHLKKSGNCGMPWPKPRLKFVHEHIII